MKIIYICGKTGTGKSTALETLVGECNIVYCNISAGMETNNSTAIGIDEYSWTPLPDSALLYLKQRGVTHLYIVTESTPEFNS